MSDSGLKAYSLDFTWEGASVLFDYSKEAAVERYYELLVKRGFNNPNGRLKSDIESLIAEHEINQQTIIYTSGETGGYGQ